MKKLIVTADNFGLDAPTNSAIIESHRNGIVTSAGLLVTREGFSEAVTLANENTGLEVGLQLDLDEFFFIDREEEKAKFYWDDTVPITKIVMTIETQIEKFQNSGLNVSFLCSRYNVHLRPELLPIICLVCRDHGIKAIRYSEKIYQQNYPGLRINWFREIVQEKGLVVTDYFIDGWYYGNLDSYNDGTAELVCRPSRYGKKSEEDFKTCINPEVKTYIETTGIQLVTFTELVKAGKE